MKLTRRQAFQLCGATAIVGAAAMLTGKELVKDVSTVTKFNPRRDFKARKNTLAAMQSFEPPKADIPLNELTEDHITSTNRAMHVKYTMFDSRNTSPYMSYEDCYGEDDEFAKENLFVQLDTYAPVYYYGDSEYLVVRFPDITDHEFLQYYITGIVTRDDMSATILEDAIFDLDARIVYVPIKYVDDCDNYSLLIQICCAADITKIPKSRINVHIESDIEGIDDHDIQVSQQTYDYATKIQIVPQEQAHLISAEDIEVYIDGFDFPMYSKDGYQWYDQSTGVLTIKMCSLMIQDLIVVLSHEKSVAALASILATKAYAANIMDSDESTFYPYGYLQYRPDLETMIGHFTSFIGHVYEYNTQLYPDTGGYPQTFYAFKQRCAEAGIDIENVMQQCMFAYDPPTWTDNNAGESRNIAIMFPNPGGTYELPTGVDDEVTKNYFHDGLVTINYEGGPKQPWTTRTVALINWNDFKDRVIDLKSLYAKGDGTALGHFVTLPGDGSTHHYSGFNDGTSDLQVPPWWSTLTNPFGDHDPMVAQCACTHAGQPFIPGYGYYNHGQNVAGGIGMDENITTEIKKRTETRIYARFLELNMEAAKPYLIMAIQSFQGVGQYNQCVQVFLKFHVRTEDDKVKATVRKIWNDGNNLDGTRPASLTVKLYANNQDTGRTATLNDGNNWTDTIADLDRYDFLNRLIAYEWKEDTTALPSGYTLNGNTGVITYKNGANDVDSLTDEVTETITTLTNNKTTPNKTTATVAKVWNDNNNQDGLRPTSLTVKLQANGQDTGKTATLNEANHWTQTIGDLDKYANQTLIAYEFVEDAAGLPQGYTLDGGKGIITYLNGTQTVSSLTADVTETKTTLTNSHTPEKTKTTVLKVWNDNNNSEGTRPASLTVTLYANGLATQRTATLNEANHWTQTLSDLDKYANGELIRYEWVEDAATLPEGYKLDGGKGVITYLNGTTQASSLTKDVTETKTTLTNSKEIAYIKVKKQFTK